MRVVLDLKALNSQLKRKQYPMPTIEEIISAVGGFHLASCLDLSMGGYLSIPVCAKSQNFLIIV